MNVWRDTLFIPEGAGLHDPEPLYRQRGRFGPALLYSRS